MHKGFPRNVEQKRLIRGPCWWHSWFITTPEGWQIRDLPSQHLSANKQMWHGWRLRECRDEICWIDYTPSLFFYGSVGSLAGQLLSLTLHSTETLLTSESDFFFFPGLKKEFFSFPIFYCNILLPLSLLQVDDLNTDPRKQKVLIRHQQKQFFFILISVHLRYHVSSYSNFLFFCWQEWVYAPGSLKLQLGFLQFSSRISNLQDIVHFVHLGHVSFILSDPFEMGMHIFSHRVYFLSLAVCN